MATFNCAVLCKPFIKSAYITHNNNNNNNWMNYQEHFQICVGHVFFWQLFLWSLACFFKIQHICSLAIELLSSSDTFHISWYITWEYFLCPMSCSSFCCLLAHLPIFLFFPKLPGSNLNSHYPDQHHTSFLLVLPFQSLHLRLQSILNLFY